MLRDLRMLRGPRWLLAARWRHGASMLLVELRQMARRQQVTRLVALGSGLRVRVRVRAQGSGSGWGAGFGTGIGFECR